MKPVKTCATRSGGWVAGLFMLAGPVSAAGGGDIAPEEWKFGGQVYLWGASIGGETTTGGDLDIPFSDLLDNLDFAFMGGLGARKGKWELAADVIYLNVDEENDGQIPLPVSPTTDLVVPVDADVRLKAWVVTPTVRYSLVENDRGSLNLLGGARYLWIDVTIKAKAESPLGFRGKIDDSGSVWNGILGVNGEINLADKWYLPYYADIGTGGSDLTWQAFAGVGYRFKKVDGLLGYRYAYWDLDDNDALDELNLSGPIAGVRFGF